MAVKFAAWGNHQFVIPSTGAPASGYKLYTYVAGSSTPVATYTTNVGNVAQSNPIVLNSAGFPTTGQIWITEGTTVKIVFTDASDVVIKTEDNIPGTNDASVTSDEWVASGLTPTFISTTSFSLVGDQTSTFNIGRRTKTTNSGGTIYSTIAASAFGAVTTVTVVNDSGVLDSGLSAVSYGLLSKTNDSMPRGIFPTIADVSGYIFGLTLSNNAGDATNDIDIAAGVADDSTHAVEMRLSSAFTKRLDANWSAGTGNGMRNSAAAIADTTYHIYLVAKANGASADIYAHTSTTVATVLTALQAESGGSSYIYARRIRSIVRASAAIVGTSQDGDKVYFTGATAAASASDPGTAAVTYTLGNIPVGIVVEAMIRASIQNNDVGTPSVLLLTPLTATDEVPATNKATLTGVQNASARTVVASGEVRVLTNTSAQIRGRVSFSSADVTLTLSPFGYIDARGRFA